MPMSSFRFEGEEDCLTQQDRVVVASVRVTGHYSPTSSTGNTYEMSEEFEFLPCESAPVTPTCGGNQLVFHDPESSDREDSGQSDGSRSGDLRMSPDLLKSIKSWYEATGLPAVITVHFKELTFQLHKIPLISRSGYLKLMLRDDTDITIPDECPGNPEIFETVAIFCYGSPVRMESSNVADLRCAAEFLQMTEDYGKANLCERSDAYLNHVALQSWKDTMVVLLRCPNLLPYAEDLGIVNRCVECLAFLACIEMVDPLEKTTFASSQHRGPSSIIESQFWSDISVSTRDTTSTTTTADSPSSSSPDWWMDDLLCLPCGLFERVIAAIRREGMQEKFIIQAIVKFVDRWLFTSSFVEPEKKGNFNAFITTEDRLNENQSDSVTPPSSKPASVNCNLVEAVVRLLPEEKDAVPINFLFSLLRSALTCKSSTDCKSQLECRIACQLELATISDFLYPFKLSEEGRCNISAVEVSCMRRIVNSFMSQQRSISDYPSETAIAGHDVVVPEENFYCAYAVSAVAKVWDEYLAEVARDFSLTPAKFAELAEVVPSYARATHDHLYRAIHVYLKVHRHFSQEERQMVCGILNCQKLSPEICSHAVQNDMMPLRMIVQAMFMQQLQTRNVLSGHLQESGLEQSTRFDSLGAGSWRRSSMGTRISTTTDSFRSSRESCISRQHDYFRDDSFGVEEVDMDDNISAPLGYMMKREAAFRQAALLKADYLATETRLQNLEEELAFMKNKMGRSKQQQHPLSKCTFERFTTTGGRKTKKESLRPVPEAITTTSDIEVEEVDADAAGDVKFSARSGNALGFLTRALRLITLGGFGRRKGSAAAAVGGGEAADGDGDEDKDATLQGPHMLCGGKGMWQTHHDDSIAVVKSKMGERTMSTLNNMVVQSYGLCASANAVKVRHNRRHSLS